MTTTETRRAVFEVEKTLRIDYHLHLPPGEPGGAGWPAILFLHGLGESGDDPARVLREGPPRLAATLPDFPFAVIAPQCPRHTWWAEMADTLDALVDECLAARPIDPRRLYLTGMSMGGYGAWHLGARRPDRFAAVAPVCGGFFPFHGFPGRVERMRGTPVRAYHGAMDPVVPLEGARRLVDALNACGGSAELVVYPDVGHDAWTRAYADPALYEWFMRHELGAAAARSGG